MASDHRDRRLDTAIITSIFPIRRAALAATAAVFGGAIYGAASQPVEIWEQSGPASKILADPTWPDTFPLGAHHLKRIDESPDTIFYGQPRVNVQHIDEHAVATLGKFYAEQLPKGGAVLDLMSSWTSHLASGSGQNKEDGHFARVAAVGMHESELKANPALHDFVSHDLNANPSLPMYAANSFDAVVCSVSVDYLADPLPVFREIHRVLKPDGLALFTWSNRMFPSKAIAAWRTASEPARLWICGSYFKYSVPDGFTPPKGFDISPYPGRTDPVYAVSARKVALPSAPQQKAEL